MNEDDAIFTDGDLSVRRVRESDLLLLQRWRNDPRVAEFYGGRDRIWDLDGLRRKYLHTDDGVTRCVVSVGARRVGAVQFYALEGAERIEYGCPPDESVWGIDVFIGEPSLWDRGIGSWLVGATAQYLLGERAADRVVVDPHVANERAIRAYQRAGFRKVRVLPGHEEHEGELRDAWLMELRPSAVP